MSILKSPISKNSWPVVWAIDTSFSQRSIHPGRALGGRYTEQMRNGLLLGRITSAHKVSIFEHSKSY